MTQRILGVGWGVFSLAFMWSVLLIAIILLYRIRALLCVLLAVLVSLITLILLVLPREDEGSKGYSAFENVGDSTPSEPILDVIFPLRLFTLLMTFAAALGGLAILFYAEIIQPRKPAITYSSKEFMANKKNL